MAACDYYLALIFLAKNVYEHDDLISFATVYLVQKHE